MRSMKRKETTEVEDGEEWQRLIRNLKNSSKFAKSHMRKSGDVSCTPWKGKEVNWEKIKWGKVSKHEEQVKRAKKRDKLCQ